jgi:hypothetical protein
VRASRAQLTSYVIGLATYLVRVGCELRKEPTLDVYDDGALGFDIEATLPGTGSPMSADIRLSETWRPGGTVFVRDEYEYELVDRERTRRRAYHRHDAETFLRRTEGAIHEHCQEVLGQPTCDHYVGLPVRDGYDAIERLLISWTEPGKLGCTSLDCADVLLGRR